jgi:hypothetical protein
MQEINNDQINRVSNDTTSLIYILSKSKEKVEIIRLDHSKILKVEFNEQKT